MTFNPDGYCVICGARTTNSESAYLCVECCLDAEEFAISLEDVEEAARSGVI